MTITREQIEKELSGYYRTGCFHIYLKGSFYENLAEMTYEDLSTFVHEYIHYLQNISTPYGIFEANARYLSIIETFTQIQEKKTISLPFRPSFSDEVQERLNWVNIMNGDHIPETGSTDFIDEQFKMSYLFDVYKGKHRKGNRVRVTYKTRTGDIKTRFIGALDIKEGMAVAYQSLLGETKSHPDIPYNLLNILCKQHFPTVYNDTKKFICICYASLYDLSPASLFIDLCLKAQADSTISGFDIFDSLVATSPIWNDNEDMTISGVFNQMVDTFKASIKGFLRVETPYIDTVLDYIKLKDGNVPILNIIHTEDPITVDNIKMLVLAVGTPFIYAQGNGWSFPALGGVAASDIVQMVGITLMSDFLLESSKSKVGICPFVTMCGEFGKYCFDKPWLEDYEKCIFRLIATDHKFENKFI